MIAELTDEEKATLEYNWRFWARPEQLPPKEPWDTWVIMTGRGWGKNRTAAEYVNALAKTGKVSPIGLVAQTPGDVRIVMLEGESGLLTISPPWFKPKYNPSKRKVTWPNGVTAITYSGANPDQLRGPEHAFLWADELAAWDYPREAWDNAMFGLRKGSAKVIVTTTPRPIALLREIIAEAGTVLTRGTTYDNRENLAATTFRRIVSRYEGTTLGRQEIYGELFDELPGALWTRSLIKRAKKTRQDMMRILVAIDPAVTSEETSNETGIIVVGKGEDGNGYVLDDLSGRYTPDGWAQVAISAYNTFHADRVVAEVNQGGDLVESTLRYADPSIPYKSVHASRGKRTRAEPIAALYEQGKIFHVGQFPELEDQMCNFLPEMKDSPDRVDALVWGMTELEIVGPMYETVVTDSGWNPYGQGF